MTQDVYITHVSAFLPGDAVGNDEMESILGMIDGRPSRARQRVLRRNGIVQRHYALDPTTGALRWNNAQLTAEAVRGLYGDPASLASIQTLACGTSVPDQIVPNHGVMVHGALKIPPCEVISTAGVCASSVAAMKYAWMAVATGQSAHAVSTGSEVASTLMRASMFEHRATGGEEIPLEQEFLRWMLSDGAGAVRLAPEPSSAGFNLKIEWIEILSYANEAPVCMYAGGEKGEDNELTGWREFSNLHAMVDRGVLCLKQDVRVLNEYLGLTVRQGLAKVRARHNLNVGEVDWFLPHISSEYFRDKLAEGLQSIDGAIPQERWFTNLAQRGNTGSASIYIMLYDLLQSGRLRAGQTLLCFVPESGRFTSAWIYLRVV